VSLSRVHRTAGLEARSWLGARHSVAFMLRRSRREERHWSGALPAMSISETFIRRPIATSLMMLGLLVFGSATYSLLPVAALPNVDFPTITVSATLPGASPETMASSVATPLQQQYTALPGLPSLNTTSRHGSTSMTLQLDLKRTNY